MKSIRRVQKQPKLKKNKCEICECKTSIEVHHIIPRCDPRCHNNNSNLALICANCHTSVHEGKIIIIGVYSTVNEDRKLMWFYEGQNPPLSKENWLIKENPFVVTIRKQ
jgi:predicted secreted Zn-dependent protease